MWVKTLGGLLIRIAEFVLGHLRAIPVSGNPLPWLKGDSVFKPNAVIFSKPV